MSICMPPTCIYACLYAFVNAFAKVHDDTGVWLDLYHHLANRNGARITMRMSTHMSVHILPHFDTCMYTWLHCVDCIGHNCIGHN